MTRSAVFAPFEIDRGRSRQRGLVLVADHASRALPEEYGGLGLPEAEFARHIAYDIGVESLTRRLAALLSAPAVLAGFSRLLIDPNRGEDDPTLIRQLYDGTVVPGNYPLTADERDRRLERFYRPYHDAVAALIASVAAAKRASAVHPVAAFLHAGDAGARCAPGMSACCGTCDHRAAWPLIEMLAEDTLWWSATTSPMTARCAATPMFRHAIVSGFAHALIEVRQDLIGDEAGTADWAARLAPIIDAINRRPDIHVVRQFGSRTGPP